MSKNGKYRALGFWAKYPEQMEQISNYFDEIPVEEEGNPTTPPPREVAELIDGQRDSAFRVNELAWKEANSLVVTLTQRASILLASSGEAKISPKRNTKCWSSSLYMLPPNSTLDFRQGIELGFDIESADNSKSSLDVISWLWLTNIKPAIENAKNIFQDEGLKVTSSREVIASWPPGVLILKRTRLASSAEDFSLDEEAIIEDALSPFNQKWLNRATLERLLEMREAESRKMTRLNPALD